MSFFFFFVTATADIFLSVFFHEKATPFPSTKHCLCSAQPFSQEMSSDVTEAFHHSFSFGVATEQQADNDECDLSCAHTSEGPPEWSTHNKCHYPQRQGPSDDRPSMIAMGPNYTLYAIFPPVK